MSSFLKNDIISKKERCEMDKKCKKFIIDIFNLIFGKGEQTHHFWSNILFKQVNETF